MEQLPPPAVHILLGGAPEVPHLSQPQLVGGPQQGIRVGHGTQNIAGQRRLFPAECLNDLGAVVEMVQGFSRRGVPVAGGQPVPAAVRPEAGSVGTALDPHLIPQVLIGQQVGQHIHLPGEFPPEPGEIGPLGGIAHTGGNQNALPAGLHDGKACSLRPGLSLGESGGQGRHQLLPVGVDADGQTAAAEEFPAQLPHPVQQGGDILLPALGVDPADVLAAGELLSGGTGAGLPGIDPGGGKPVAHGDQPLLVFGFLLAEHFLHRLGVGELGGVQDFGHQRCRLLPVGCQADQVGGENSAVAFGIPVEHTGAEAQLAGALPDGGLQLGSGAVLRGQGAQQLSQQIQQRHILRQGVGGVEIQIQVYQVVAGFVEQHRNALHPGLPAM